MDSNINLLNPDGKDIINPGDMRDGSFTVTNEGNKSIDVRTTIALTAQAHDGTPLTFTGDSETQSEYDLYLASDVEFVEGYGYMPKEGAKPLQVKSINNDIITYVVPEYVLNGNSDKYDEVETVDGVTEFTHTNEFVFVMKGGAGNEWQDSSVSLDVLVEAKQHENTAAGWDIVAQENVSIGSINQDAVVGENVITDDVNMRIVWTGGSPVVNPPLQAAEAAYGEELMTVEVVSDSSIYNQLLNSGYTDVSRDQNMDVIAGVIGGNSTVSAVDTTGGAIFYLAAEDNTIIMAPEDVTNMFANLRHIKQIILENLYFNNTTDMSGMFAGSSNLEEVIFAPVNKAPVVTTEGVTTPSYSNVTDISSMYNGCTNIENVDMSEFKNVADASNAFTGCENIKNVDLSGMDYVDITWLTWMYENADSLEKIVISAKAEQTIKKESTADEFAAIKDMTETVGTLPPVEKVEGEYAQLITGYDLNVIFKALNETDPYTKVRFVSDTGIFEQVKATPNYQEVSDEGISAFIGVIGDTCYVATQSDKIIYAPVDSSYMFEGLTWVTVIDVQALNTEQVTNMAYMFSGCYILTKLDLSSFDTAKVTNAKSMFDCSRQLVTIYVGGLWQMNVDAANSERMFYDCYKIVGQSGTKFNSNNLNATYANHETGYLTFYNGKENTIVAGPNFNTLIPAETTEIYFGDYHDRIPDSGLIDMSVSADESVVAWLEGTTLYITSRDGKQINTTGSMYQMFSDRAALTTIVFDNIDTSAALNMSYMFYCCTSLANLDIATLSTSRVTNMSYMFYACMVLPSVDVSGFDTSKVTDMSHMFDGLYIVTALDVSGFKTSKVTNMEGMFTACRALTELDLSSFDTAKVTNVKSMFSSSRKLVTIYVGDLWQMNVDAANSANMFYDCYKITGQSGTKFNSSYLNVAYANYETGYLTYKAA